jgi:DNA-binding CsgD family transcriptional regulator
MSDADRTPVVVGREAERVRVDTFAAALPHGARSLTITGEAGIGKTALWRHAVERCRAAEYLVLVTRPAEEEMPLALVGLVDLFEHGGLDPGPLLAEDDPFARGRHVLQALRRLAGARPTVVAIDDLQWLDAASARALRYALRRLDAEPVGLLASARAGAGEAEPLEPAACLPPGRAERLQLGPLDAEALRRLLAGTVDSISRPALRRIHEASAGNPLYALELARSLDGRGVQLPESLQGAIERRLAAAPPELAPLLETASAMGPAPVRELRGALPGQNVDRLLLLAEEHGLLVVEDDLQVRFSHPLVGSAVYRRLTPLARRALHRGLAAAAADDDLRARHLALSSDAPDAGVAGRLELAAERARRRGAPELAAEFARHSLRLTPPEDAADGARRARAEIQNLAAAGEVKRALALADRLVAGLPAGPERAGALVQRAMLEDDDRATAERLLLQALDDAGGDERLRCRALQRLAMLRRERSGDLAGAVACARQALVLAERVGDPELVALNASYVAHIEATTGTPRRDLLAQAVALEEQLDGPGLAMGARSMLVKQLRWDGELAQARAGLETLRRTVVRTGAEIQRPQYFYDLALVECDAGDFGTAERVVLDGIEAARDAENTRLERELLHPLALVQVWLGRADAARETASRLRAEAVRYGVRPLLVREREVRGLLALSEGDAEAAALELAAAAVMLAEMGFANPGAFPILPNAIEALARAGDVTAAGALFDRLEREAATAGGAWVGAAVQHAAGVLLLAHGGGEAALAPLEAAVSELDRVGHRPAAARAVLTRGRALLRAGQRTAAADGLADARRRFSELGAVLWEARAVEELERAAPGRAAGELTETERRVAELVAQGLKNREIAETLFMSVATVEAHLTRTYRKLEIRSRSELTSRVADGSLDAAQSA